MYKVGLVGTGFWSEKHLKAWQRIPNVEIAALCNRSKQKLVHKAEEYGVAKEHLYSSLEEMLDNADIDIVEMATRLKCSSCFQTVYKMGLETIVALFVIQLRRFSLDRFLAAVVNQCDCAAIAIHF